MANYRSKLIKKYGQGGFSTDVGDQNLGVSRGFSAAGSLFGNSMAGQAFQAVGKLSAHAEQQSQENRLLHRMEAVEAEALRNSGSNDPTNTFGAVSFADGGVVDKKKQKGKKQKLPKGKKGKTQELNGVSLTQGAEGFPYKTTLPQDYNPGVTSLQFPNNTMERYDPNQEPFNDKAYIIPFDRGFLDDSPQNQFAEGGPTEDNKINIEEGELGLNESGRTIQDYTGDIFSKHSIHGQDNSNNIVSTDTKKGDVKFIINADSAKEFKAAEEANDQIRMDSIVRKIHNNTKEELPARFHDGGGTDVKSGFFNKLGADLSANGDSINPKTGGSYDSQGSGMSFTGVTDAIIGMEGMLTDQDEPLSKKLGDLDWESINKWYGSQGAGSINYRKGGMVPSYEEGGSTEDSEGEGSGSFLQGIFGNFGKNGPQLLNYLGSITPPDQYSAIQNPYNQQSLAYSDPANRRIDFGRTRKDILLGQRIANENSVIGAQSTGAIHNRLRSNQAITNRGMERLGEREAMINEGFTDRHITNLNMIGRDTADRAGTNRLVNMALKRNQAQFLPTAVGQTQAGIVNNERNELLQSVLMSAFSELTGLMELQKGVGEGVGKVRTEEKKKTTSGNTESDFEDDYFDIYDYR